MHNFRNLVTLHEANPFQVSYAQNGSLANMAESNADDGEVKASWKEIAAYLHRGIRTVQRWHAELQLPVHKSDSKARAHVFAYKAELDEWVRQRAQQEATRNVLSLIKRQRDRIARITDTIDGIVTKLRQQVGSRRNNVG